MSSFTSPRFSGTFSLRQRKSRIAADPVGRAAHTAVETLESRRLMTVTPVDPAIEGIAVESYSKPDAAFDITTIGAEFSVVIKSIQRAAQMLEAGETAEVAIQAEKMLTLIRVVNETYFVAFSMLPDANIGKARYMLRTRVPVLLKELS